MTQDTNELLEAALGYVERGWHVFPCRPRSKKPLTAHGFLDASKDEGVIRAWWKKTPHANIGIACGASGLVVVDPDGPEGIEIWKQWLDEHDGGDDNTLTALTPGGGLHLVYRAPDGDPIICSQSWLGPGIDVKANGGYIVVAPSVHPNGKKYQWDGQCHSEPQPLPAPILEALRPQQHRTDNPGPRPVRTTLAGDIVRAKAALGKLSPDRCSKRIDWIAVGMTMHQLGPAGLALWDEWSQECKSKWKEGECAKIWKGFTDKENGLTLGSLFHWAEEDAGPDDEIETTNDKRKAMKDVVLELALAEDIALFTDQHRNAFCRTPRHEHFEILPVNGDDFGDWLGWLLYTQDGRTCSKQTLDPAKQVLRAMAKYDGASHKLHNRTAWGDDGALYYDMSDDQWRAIRITPEGWTIDPAPPILFKRYAHQVAMKEPERMDNALEVLAELFKFVNLAGASNQLLFTVYLASLFIPGIAHPIPVLHGEQGCGKTFALKTVRRLVDPSDIGTLGVPWKSDEFVQQLDHHWCAFYDNLKSLTDWQQDVICRAVTGEGHTKRKLYSDNEDIIFTYRRCIALNGINVSSTRPDLLDRSILFELDALSDRRRTESEMEMDFEILKPRLVGAILDVLAGALGADANTATGLGRYFRLADWAAWGWRIGEALGGWGNEFINTYNDAIQGKALMALELHPLGQAVMALMNDCDEWAGKPKELLEKLNEVAGQEGIDVEDKAWPKSAAWVGRRLREIRPDLRTVGITCSTERDGTRRTLCLKSK